MLRLPCSLTAVRGEEEPDEDHEGVVFEKRLKSIEENIQEMKDMFMSKTHADSEDRRHSQSSSDSRDIATDNGGRPTSSDALRQGGLDVRNELAPMTVIRNIDYKIFSRNERYEPMQEGSAELVQWIKQRPQYCHKMSAIFIQKCAGYVIRHSVANCSPLLLGVMTLQGMRLDMESTHDDLQRQLFPLVRNLLAIGLMTSPLRHDDIEAMMYMAHFNVARKPLQPIFDSWLLTGYAIKLYILSVRFADIVSRTESPLKHTTEHDLYLFRLWNSLCQCHLQYAGASCRQVVIPSDYLAQCSKIVLLEGANQNDAITVTEIKLLTKLSQIPMDRNILSFIGDWYENALPLFPSDKAKSLAISYYYALVIASHRPEAEITPEQAAFVAENCKSVIALFLELGAGSIEAMPNYPLCILIYACIILCKTNTPDHQGTLILMTKVYWYISHLGVKPRDITHSIANIIKNVIETSNNVKLDHINSSNIKLESSQGMHTGHGVSMQPQSTMGNMPLNRHLTDANLDSVEMSNLEEHRSAQKPPSSILDEYVVNSMDVTRYSSYDDFFEKVFSMV